ncbi:hypothetical protein BaRGS_00029544 [Batillaria attramentaria]|uniref:Uncharacterized protein n=1 Tax=Batillaria attramentaria TaxID=370345 RepID=A0ABD0JX86_9CAEN
MLSSKNKVQQTIIIVIILITLARRHTEGEELVKRSSVSLLRKGDFNALGRMLVLCVFARDAADIPLCLYRESECCLFFLATRSISRGTVKELIGKDSQRAKSALYLDALQCLCDPYLEWHELVSFGIDKGALGGFVNGFSVRLYMYLRTAFWGPRLAAWSRSVSVNVSVTFHVTESVGGRSDLRERHFGTCVTS